MPRQRGFWILCLLPILAAGCNRIIPTVYVPTATPTWFPVTPEPTPTPLFRAREITSADYGQSLTLYVSDEVILHWLPEGTQPLTIENPNVVQISGDPAVNPLTLVAVGAGTARISSIVAVPCPTSDSPVVAHCRPPQDLVYVTVTVIEP